MKTLLLVLVSITFALAIAELTARWLGHSPVQFVHHPQEPVLFTPDDETGWRNREGSFTYPGYSRAVSEVTVTNSSEGFRATYDSSKSRIAADGGVVVVGGSYTQGLAISDHETYAWQLQRSFPELEFYNLGTAGFSTYQSLLALEEHLPGLPDVKYVVYGLIPHHLHRNVATDLWIEALARQRSKGKLKLPAVSLDEQGGLVRHEPESLLVLPWRDRLATVALLNRLLNHAIANGREKQMSPAFVQLVSDMDSLVSSHGAQLVVVLLDGSSRQKEWMSGTAKTLDADYIDCATGVTADLRVKGEGHPNGKMNKLWSKCIGKHLTSLQE